VFSACKHKKACFDFIEMWLFYSFSVTPSEIENLRLTFQDTLKMNAKTGGQQDDYRIPKVQTPVDASAGAGYQSPLAIGETSKCDTELSGPKDGAGTNSAPAHGTASSGPSRGIGRKRYANSVDDRRSISKRTKSSLRKYLFDLKKALHIHRYLFCGEREETTFCVSWGDSVFVHIFPPLQVLYISVDDFTKAHLLLAEVLVKQELKSSSSGLHKRGGTSGKNSKCVLLML
jgi:hypothetical protein